MNYANFDELSSQITYKFIIQYKKDIFFPIKRSALHRKRGNI